ncbi:MAG: PhoH family protein, partial [Acidobacteria bacterium]|nr:PhoH family protein [Acidobacteriota bacterium]
AKTSRVIGQVTGLLREGDRFSREDVRRASEMVSEDAQIDLRDFFLKAPLRASSTRHVTPKTLGQRRYLDAIERHDVVFGIGPAGTGKTYLAMAQAVAYLTSKRVSRIILARPAVEAGEKLGFLPGDVQEKVNPYLRPLYDALYDMLHSDKVGRLIDRGVIEIAPIAFMRGRTLNDAFVILDEAQNTTPSQMKMFLSLLGFVSKSVVNGDITQIDLPAGQTSGVVQALRVLHGVEGVSIVHFTDRDVVRHPLVQRIVKAYERYVPARPAIPPNLHEHRRSGFRTRP